MNNRLLIDNFLIFKKAEVDVNKITIFIGPQASGKSIVAKLLFVFYNIPNIIYSVAVDDGKKREFTQRMRKQFADIFPTSSWDKTDFSITFRTDFGKISFSHEKRKSLTFEMSDYYTAIINKVLLHGNRKAMHDVSERDYAKYRMARMSWAETQIHQCRWGFIDNAGGCIFIPAGRSFFATLSNNIFTFLSSDNKLDYFLRDFGMRYEWARKFYSHPGILTGNFPRNSFDKICKRMLNAVYSKKFGKEFLIHGEGDLEVEVKDASSGQQELLPILFAMSRENSSFCVVEEPEAHIFPATQSEIVRYIIKSQRVLSEEKVLLITTHSPYILTTLNNLAYAGVLESKLRDEQNIDAVKKLNDLYSGDERILCGFLSAYYFENGKIKDIVDKETGLINAENLDKISTVTDDKFSELIELELQSNNGASPDGRR